MIGAIHQDQGMDAARAWLLPLIDPCIRSAAESGHQNNYKSVLQQHAQQKFDATPDYVILDEQGPDHSKCFKVAVELDGRTFEPAWGQSKKQAEQQPRSMRCKSSARSSPPVGPRAP